MQKNGIQSILLKIIRNYNGANSYLFVNGTEIHKFKAKDSEIVTTPSCLGVVKRLFYR